MFVRSTARTAFASLAAISVLAAGASAANATAGDELDPGVTVDTQVIDFATLNAAAGVSTQADQSSRNAYTESQARSGRLVDAAATRTATVGDTTVTWDAALVLDSVVVDTLYGETSAEPQGQGVAIVTAGEQANVTSGTAPLSAGAGLSAGQNAAGGNYINGSCASTTTTGGTATSCFEKYKLKQNSSTRDHFYYGRWATATGASNAWTPTQIDIRSRPHKNNTSIATMSNYWPKAGQNVCAGGGTFGFSASGFSISIPIQQCSDLTPIPNGTTMGVIYDQGAIYNGRSKGTDFGMVVDTFKNKTAYLADYTYVKFCGATYLSCDGNLRKDSTW